MKNRHINIKGNILNSTIIALSLIMVNSAYAEQTCMSQITATAPDSRFTISTDGKEVTDNQTNLVWQRCSIGQSWNGSSCEGTATNLTWKQALDKVNSLGNGYRLPNIKEAATIVEAQCMSPALNANVFPNVPEPEPYSYVQYSLYWTSSPIPNQGEQAYVFDYHKGTGLAQQPGLANKDALYYSMAKGYARAVRSN